ncbi:hypothetical protein GHT06_009756 [Daphnia sinensis]|uniref:Uncharacterized protein n=1 Tax=Daphnia sinensis TaxID=1820382 RepID=A0AAD5LPB7_9CRUS|nr:hypothetical protein GHT06_009756 [Daphnia sinensis]
MFKSLLFTLLFAVASMTITVDAAPSDSYYYLSQPSGYVYDYSREYMGYVKSADGKTTVPVYYGSGESFEWDDIFERPRLVATKSLTLRDILKRISAQTNPVY